MKRNPPKGLVAGEANTKWGSFKRGKILVRHPSSVFLCKGLLPHSSLCRWTTPLYNSVIARISFQNDHPPAAVAGVLQRTILKHICYCWPLFLFFRSFWTPSRCKYFHKKQVFSDFGPLHDRYKFFCQKNTFCGLFLFPHNLQKSNIHKNFVSVFLKTPRIIRNCSAPAKWFV